MGTRYITEVILNGKTVIKQYGQWDGYPTWAGKNICEFLKNADLSEFKNHIRGNVTFMPKLSEKDEKRLNERLHRTLRVVLDYPIALNNGEFPTVYLHALALMNKGKISVEDFIEFISLHRDMGCKILDAILLYDSKFKLIRSDSKEYVEGEYTIDLDNEHVDMWYHGENMRYTFEQINKMDIAREMKSFEERGE